MWRIIGLGITAAVACVLAAAPAARACSMVPGWQPPSADARVAGAALAVIGTVGDVEAPGPGVPAASYAFTFTVERVVKGATQVSQVRLRTYRGGALCGFEAQPGQVLGLALDGLAEDQVVTVFSLFDPQALGRDPDLDNVDASLDNCPNVANPGQEDADGDGIGNACETAAPPNQPVATPRSTVTVPTARGRRPLLRGTATVENGGDGAPGLAGVRVSVVRTDGRRCRALTADGRWTRYRKLDGRCAPRFLLAPRGLERWTLRLPAGLRPGRYVVSSSARLANGAVEAPDAANRTVVRVPRR